MFSPDFRPNGYISPRLFLPRLAGLFGQNAKIRNGKKTFFQTKRTFLDAKMLVRAVVLAAISQVVRCIPVGAADAGQECVFGGSDGVARIGMSKASCSSLVISAMEIAAGETLDLTNLREGSTVSCSKTPKIPKRQ